MKTVYIRCPNFSIKEEEDKNDQSMSSGQEIICKKRITEQTVKCQKSVVSFTSSSTSQLSSSTSKQIHINEKLTYPDQTIAQQDQPFDHYSHYFQTFNNQFQKKSISAVAISDIKTRRNQSASHIPYEQLIDSIGQSNILRNDDEFRQIWISFMENYSIEKLGLNLGFINSPIEMTQKYDYQQNENLSKIVQKKSSQKKQFKNSNQINISDVILPFIIPEFLEDLIQTKFCLYIQSSYKALKSNNNNKQQSSLDQEIFNIIFSPNLDVEQQNQFNIKNFSPNNCLNQNSNPSNFSSKIEPLESESSENLKSEKKYHFNMSKYFMLFMLELLRNEHLDAFDQITDSMASEIQSVVSLIQMISKKNSQSKTNYYNHYHYDALFLQLNDQTLKVILKNKKLLEIHQQIFRVQNLNCQFAIQRINITKQYLSQIIISQLQFLKKRVQLINQQQTLSKSMIEDINSKINYLYRVEQGIIELSTGKTINRF